MSGGSSSSKKETQNITNTTTNVTTNTSTDIGEIGLTGDDAVAITDLLSTANVMTAKVNQQSLEALVQESGKGYKQLIGGANNLIKTAGTASTNYLKQSQAFGQNLIGAAQSFGNMLVKAGEGIANPASMAQETVQEQTKAIKQVLMVGLAVGGVVFFYKMKGRGK